jgi:AraC-like DNA-binding protein
MPVDVSDPLDGTEGPIRGRIYGYDSAPVVPGRLYSDMHRTFEVDIVLDGHIEYIFGDDVPRTFGPGDVVLIPAWEPHFWRSNPQGFELVIQFLPEFLGEETVAGSPWLSLFAMPPADRPRITSREARQQVAAIIPGLRQELEEQAFGWQDGVRFRLLQLLLVLARTRRRSFARAVEPRYGGRNLDRLVPALEMVYGDTSRRVSREEAARRCALSGRQFATIFRRTMGISFAKFSVRFRTKEAARLLRQTQLPIDRVAEMTGFVDDSHLRRVFASTFGMTPSAYRHTQD